MYFEYNNVLYNIKLIKKNNKNTYIRVRNNEIYITTNFLVSNNSIRKLITENRDAIIKMIERNNQRNDSSFKLFGESYTIIYSDSIDKIEISNKIICAKDIKMLNKYMSSYVKDTFQKHLDYWYNIFEEKIPTPNLKIRKMTTRWGVCNLKNKNVTLNLELLKYDIVCLDYVIVHELSHFIYPDHSSNFWKLVSKYCPKYKEIRKKLKS